LRHRWRRAADDQCGAVTSCTTGRANRIASRRRSSLYRNDCTDEPDRRLAVAPTLSGRNRLSWRFPIGRVNSTRSLSVAICCAVFETHFAAALSYRRWLPDWTKPPNTMQNYAKSRNFDGTTSVNVVPVSSVPRRSSNRCCRAKLDRTPLWQSVRR